MGITLKMRKMAYLKEGTAYRELARKAEGFFGKICEDPEIGFTGLPENLVYVDRCDEALNRLPAGSETLYVLGIGGSALGTSMLINAFSGSCIRKVVVVDNVDGSTVNQLLREMNPETSVINVISKSGSTVEPLSLFSIFFEHFVAKLGREEAFRRVVVTTDVEKGALRQLAEEENLISLPIPGNVGGRFSVLTPVGLFPAMFAGIDVVPLLLGAKREKREGQSRAVCGAVLDYLFQEQGRNIKVLFPYCDRLKTFGDWYLQLFAESLGKLKNRRGMVVRSGQTGVVAVGVTDQHSQLQLYKEGPGDKSFFFFTLENQENIPIPDVFGRYPSFQILRGKSLGKLMLAEAEGTMQSLEKNSLPVFEYTLSGIDGETLGALIFMFEMQTAITGYLMNVNPFDQPGVEEGKIIARKLLED
ncbi:MAG: glucose-6-phosphate isomerase [Acidobacteria bacterium]|nr:glucose-6-phosphate isomerase [Acidobacteriota bacterium]